MAFDLVKRTLDPLELTLDPQGVNDDLPGVIHHVSTLKKVLSEAVFQPIGPGFHVLDVFSGRADVKNELAVLKVDPFEVNVDVHGVKRAGRWVKVEQIAESRLTRR